MSTHLTPSQVCERLLGKPERLGEITGLHPKSAYHWRNERKGRAAGDLPTTQIMRALLAHSAAHQLGLTAEHLIWGASQDEVAEILASRGQPIVRAAE